MSKILVVEDDTDLRFLYGAMLSRHGYDVTAAENTVDAILTLTNEVFDLLILDMNIPDLPGVKIIEFVRDDVRLKYIPIVVISASESWRGRVHDLGVQHFLIKPVPMEQLCALVDHLLGSGASGGAHP